MKRYLVFAGDCYYPAGGWEDFINSFDDLQQARDCVLNLKYEWFQVVDCTISKVLDFDEAGI